MHMVIDGTGMVSIPNVPSARRGHDGMQLGRLPSRSVGDLLAAWSLEYSAWQRQFPKLGVLCRQHGDVVGARLYSRDAVIRKWCTIYQAAQRSS